MNWNWMTLEEAKASMPSLTFVWVVNQDFISRPLGCVALGCIEDHFSFALHGMRVCRALQPEVPSE